MNADRSAWNGNYGAAVQNENKSMNAQNNAWHDDQQAQQANWNAHHDVSGCN
jgi:hypothetical protein